VESSRTKKQYDDNPNSITALVRINRMDIFNYPISIVVLVVSTCGA
jgi:hypothetical protein